MALFPNYVTKPELKKLIDNRPHGMSPDGIVQSLLRSGKQIEGLYAPRDPDPGPLAKVGHFIQDVARNANQEIIDTGRYVIDRGLHPGKAVQDVRGLAELAGRTIVGTGENIYQGITGNAPPQFAPGGSFGDPNSVSTPAGPTQNQQTANAVWTSIAEGVKHPIETFREKPIGTALIVAPVVGAVAKGTGISSSVGSQVKQIRNKQARSSASKAAAEVDNIIDEGIAKGIRPSVSGKATAAQVQKFHNQSREAVKTIVKEKAALRLVDEFGEALPEGSLPQNLSQFSQAVDQTKKNLFKKYDSIKRSAGDAGAEIDLNPVVSELDRLADNKPIRDLNPSLADYARRRAEALATRGKYSMDDAQDALQSLNGSLEAYYRNPSPQTYGQAQVDALIANNLRKSLDDTITNAKGPGYAELRKAYGAMKSIEADLNKRLVVEARKNAKGLIDFSDVFSAGDVVSGIVSGNPAFIAKGAVQKGIASYLKFRNNPNQVVRNMFKRLDERLNSLPDRLAPYPDLYQQYSGVKPNFTDPSSIPDDIPLSQVDNVEASRVDTLNKAGLPEDKLPGGYPK